MAYLLPGTDPVHKVTIIPRGRALGLTMQLPEDDHYTHSRSYLLAQIAILFGGRVAEKLVFDDVTTGASNDIERATELARNRRIDNFFINSCRFKTIFSPSSFDIEETPVHISYNEHQVKLVHGTSELNS